LAACHTHWANFRERERKRDSFKSSEPRDLPGRVGEDISLLNGLENRHIIDNKLATWQAFREHGSIPELIGADYSIIDPEGDGACGPLSFILSLVGGEVPRQELREAGIELRCQVIHMLFHVFKKHLDEAHPDLTPGHPFKATHPMSSPGSGTFLKGGSLRTHCMQEYLPWGEYIDYIFFQCAGVILNTTPSLITPLWLEHELVEIKKKDGGANPPYYQILNFDPPTVYKCLSQKDSITYPTPRTLAPPIHIIHTLGESPMIQAVDSQPPNHFSSIIIDSV
jgi:hypothetical protein